MKYWMYIEPATETCSVPVYTILSEAAILAQYWTYWRDKMAEANKLHEATEARCIEDWATTHWAVEATPTSLAKIIGYAGDNYELFDWKSEATALRVNEQNLVERVRVLEKYRE